MMLTMYFLLCGVFGAFPIHTHVVAVALLIEEKLPPMIDLYEGYFAKLPCVICIYFRY